MPVQLHRQIRLFLAAWLIASFLPANGQSPPDSAHSRIKSGHSFNLSAGLLIPTGQFFDTHFPGAGLQVLYSHQRRGNDAKPRRKTGLIASAGLDHFFGKEIMVSANPYRYPAFTLISLGGGLVNHSVPGMQWMLTAAPAMGIYDGNTRYYTSAAIQAFWKLSGRTGIQPGLHWMKEKGALSDWFLSLKASCLF